MKKQLLVSLIYIISIVCVSAQTYTGVFKSTSDNTDYHHFVRNHEGGAAVYVNQVSTGPIFRVSSGTSEANQNVQFTIENNGNVGIGTIYPSTKLAISGSHVTGKGLLNLTSESGSIAAITFYHATNYSGAMFAGTDNDMYLGAANSNNIKFYTNISSNVKMILDSEGNLGIGTTTPTNKLEVAGTIRAEEIKVETGWADFVFHPTYNLRPLQEVNTYIQQNGHLPEIPTAKEVEENGVSLGEMNAKLLQKIEELTLYTIEQEKRIKELEEQNKRIDRLESIINELSNKY